ncbi:MAG: arylsulfatase A-like enzyme, partial [Rhodothermales bacterium]
GASPLATCRNLCEGFMRSRLGPPTYGSVRGRPPIRGASYSIAKTDTTVSLLDMYPTLAELCDLPKPQQRLEGRSIAHILAKPADQPDHTIVLPYIKPGEYAIINRDWRFIHYKDGEELYNLRKDPNECVNTVAEPRHEKLVDTLRGHSPKSFAEPGAKFNVRNDLVVEGETWRWERNANRQKNSKPALKNVLLIVCDDLNTHVSPSGYDPIHTPTLASFAKESITFQRAFCQYPVWPVPRVLPQWPLSRIFRCTRQQGRHPADSAWHRNHAPILQGERLLDR